jgi:hypothetical protein
MGPEILFSFLALVFLLVWGLSVGRTKSVISLLSMYVAYGITITFPYFDKLSLNNDWARAILFIIAFAVVLVIFSISFLRKRLSSGEFNLFGVLLITLLQIGLLAAILIQLMPADLAGRYLGSLAKFFTGQAFFGWFVAPLPALLVMSYLLRS